MSKVNCNNIYIKESSICKKFDGAFAKKEFKKGELVEYGIVRVLPTGFNGHESPHVFTWSDDLPNTIWAMASGCATFYNTANKNDANVEFVRDYKNLKFDIIALRDIKKNEELFHTYKSLQWRGCFNSIKDI